MIRKNSMLRSAVFVFLLVTGSKSNKLDCPAGFVGLGSNCYHFNDMEPMPWPSAVSFCMNQHENATLVEMTTPEELKLITEYLEMHNETCLLYWTGGFETGLATKEFMWLTTGTDVHENVTNWMPGYPKNETCLTGIAIECDKGMKNPRLSVEGYPICEMTGKPPQLPEPNVECPVGYEAVVDYCYALLKREMLNWWAAKRQCKEWGGYLAELMDEDQIKYTRTWLMKDHGKCHDYSIGAIFVGGREMNDSNKFEWVNSMQPVEETDWNEQDGEPNNPGKGDVIGLDCHEHFLWQDYIPEGQNNYMCQTEGVPITTTPPPTTTTGTTMTTTTGTTMTTTTATTMTTPGTTPGPTTATPPMTTTSQMTTTGTTMSTVVPTPKPRKG